MSLALLLWALVLAAASTGPGLAEAQDPRQYGPSTGRRYWMEQAERARQRRQQWEAEEQETRRRVRARQQKHEDWMEQRRKEAIQTPLEP